MRKGHPDRRYIRTGDHEVLAITYKAGSTSMTNDLKGPCSYGPLKKGDHVVLYVRDPHDRLVSAWKWFTGHHNCYIKDILEECPQDHDYLLDSRSPFDEWVHVALQYWNPHWAPQTEIHPRWREFELRDLQEYGGSHEKRTRPDNTWEQYYDEALLALVEKVYAEDLEMWKEVTDGIDTRARRVL